MNGCRMACPSFVHWNWSTKIDQIIYGNPNSKQELIAEKYQKRNKNTAMIAKYIWKPLNSNHDCNHALGFEVANFPKIETNLQERIERLWMKSI